MHLGLSKGQTIVVICIYLVLLGMWLQAISPAPIEGDAKFNAMVGVNLQHHGSYSRDRSQPRYATMYREPVPVLATAAMVAAVDAALGPAERDAYFTGERARLLKLQNLLWATLLCGASFLATFRLTSSFAASLLAGILSYAVFLYPAMRPAGIDSLASEIGAAALLVWASWCYALGVSKRSARALAGAALLFGVLALIKAVALYIFFGMLMVLLVMRFARRREIPMRDAWLEAGLMLLLFAAIVGPWMYRNWVQFETPAIAQRGGLALFHRALFNEVEGVEYEGLFYAWAPSPIRAAVGRLLGFSPADLQRGGPLFRLNARVLAPDNVAAIKAGRPQEATSIMAEGLAERARILQALQASGRYGPSERAHVRTDELLKARALERMVDHPGGMLAVTLAACWRGAFLVLPLLGCALLLAWRQRREDVFAFCVPALGLTIFYGLFSHFEPRYGAIMTPIALIAVIAAALGTSSWARLRARFLARLSLGFPSMILRGARIRQTTEAAPAGERASARRARSAQ